MQENRTYSPEEVEAIVSLATRLQTEHREQATLQEIEQAAAEFGVDPKFVKLAAIQIDRAQIPPVPAVAAPPSLSMAPFKVMLVLYVLTLLPAMALVTGVNVAGGGFWPAVASFFIFGVGLTFPIRKPLRLMLVPIASTAVATIVVAGLLAFDVVWRPYRPYWINDMPYVIFGQLALALLGFLMARVIETLSRDNGYAGLPNRGR